VGTIKQLFFLVLILTPLFYIVYRVRNRNIKDLLGFVGLIVVYIIIHKKFIFGGQFVFHDAMWSNHIYYAVIDQWIQNGYSIGWNPFMNGGEPLYLYSNYFLWAEFVWFSLLNKLIHLPVHQLINLYFTYIFISYFTFSFVLFSLFFKKSPIVFFPASILVFSGLTQSSMGQYVLSPLYFLPLTFINIYLFVIKKDLIYLLWTMFFVCVSANHYLPHYLIIFLVTFIVSWHVAKFVSGKIKFETPELVTQKVSKFSWKYAMFISIFSVLVLAPVIFGYLEIEDYISPTRGGAELGKIKEFHTREVQTSVNQSLDRYKHLVEIARHVDPENHSWRNLRYHHGVYYVGIPALIFLFFSFFYIRKSTKVSPLHLGCLISALTLVYMALGDDSLLWQFCKYNIPLFFLRHSYPISHAICFLIIVLSTFGFFNLVKSDKWRYMIILMVIIISGFVILKPTHFDNKTPFELKPFIYPDSRSLYSQGIAPVPFDTTSLITKKASATHPSEDFTFFRTRSFDKLLKENPEFTTGGLFVFTKVLKSPVTNIKEIPVQYIINNNPNFLKIKAEIAEDGYLIRKENFHKNWTARINNHIEPISKYANVFQAVKVSKGTINAEFTFSSIYPLLFWLHVIFVFIGYIVFFRYLTADLPSPGQSRCGTTVENNQGK
jgi:hypothetical protein